MKRVLLVVAFSALALTAQDDPPSRVARLNWISGDVAYQPASMDDWTSATLNYPLTTGDHLFVNAGSRAELHIGPNAIRLNSNSNFSFLNLDDAGIQMSLNQGVLELRLRQLEQGDSWEIDTPNGALTLLRAGEYRIDLDPGRNATIVTVRTGQAEMYQDGNSQLISPHQTVWFRDGGGPEIHGESLRDEFDAFATSRNNAEDSLPRRDYVPESMVGYQDLYAYGTWQNEPDYGWAWAPPVAYGWAPYSTGRWAYVEPWGWTWIDEAPWGFAPFHYGRWAWSRSRWLWIPGAREFRPVYSPALVVFVGGNGWGMSVGWFPLGPREPWIPSWRASEGYMRRANEMHVSNFNVNINVNSVNYANRGNPRALTAVSRGDFAGSRSVRGAAMRMNPGQAQGGQIMGSAPPIAPGRSSVLGGGSRQRPAISDRQVIARTPPPPAPVSFDARQQALNQNQGRPLDRGQVDQLRRQQPAAVVSHVPVRTAGGQQQRGPVPQITRPDDTRPQDRMGNRPQNQSPQTQPAPPLQQQRTPEGRPFSQPQPVTPQTQPAPQNRAPDRQQTAPQTRQFPLPQPATPQAQPTPQNRPPAPQQRAPESRQFPPAQPATPQAQPVAPQAQPAPQNRPPAQQQRAPESRQFPPAQPATPQAQPVAPQAQPAPQNRPGPPPRLQSPPPARPAPVVPPAGRSDSKPDKPEKKAE